MFVGAVLQNIRRGMNENGLNDNRDHVVSLGFRSIIIQKVQWINEAVLLRGIIPYFGYHMGTVLLKFYSMKREVRVAFLFSMDL